MARLAGALVALTLIAVAAPSSAEAIKYVGKTSQGERVKLLTDAKGVPKEVGFPWKDDCITVFDPFRFVRPFEQATASKLVDGGRSHFSDPHDVVLRVDSRIRMTRKSDRRWVGHFSARTKDLQHGDVYASCRVGFDIAANRVK